jgi:hypothetical protein
MSIADVMDVDRLVTPLPPRRLPVGIGRLAA